MIENVTISRVWTTVDVQDERVLLVLEKIEVGRFLYPRLHAFAVRNSDTRISSGSVRFNFENRSALKFRQLFWAHFLDFPTSTDPQCA